MKTLKLFFTMAILALCSSSVFAQNGNSNGNGNSGQNGNAVISAVHLYDNGNGTGTIEVRVSGNLAPLEPSGSFTISGDRIPYGKFQNVMFGSKSQEMILVASFPLLPAVGNADFVEVEVYVSGKNAPTIGGWWKKCPKDTRN